MERPERPDQVSGTADVGVITRLDEHQDLGCGLGEQDACQRDTKPFRASTYEAERRK
ncbi:MAG: hypothetical protein KDB08_01640 [Microthrixaceae bacterium]|nr:hypothetical protein [Microthrixaceae bacterium]